MRLTVTHADLDMAGCLLNLFYFKLDKNYDRILTIDYKSYEKDFDYDLIKNSNEVLYMDMTPDQKSLDIIIENNIKCTILDHHISWYNDVWVELGYNKRELPNVNYIFDNEKSGTLISFEYFKSLVNMRVTKAYHDIVSLIDTYDLWKDESELFEDAQNLNRLFWKKLTWYHKDYKRYIGFIYYMLDRIKNTQGDFKLNREESNICTEVRLIERSETNKAFQKMMIRKDSLGRSFGVIRASKKISIIAYRILKNTDSIEYIAIINEYDKNELKISLRAKPHINLLEIPNAKGHELASGFKDVNNLFIEKFYSGEIYSLI